MTLRSWFFAAIVALSLALPLGLQTAAVNSAGYLAGDFRAFYCAARAARAGASPYAAAPLHECEQSIDPSTFFVRNPGVTIPAPLPGYALALIAPLARLPFALAAWIWTVVALISVAGCVVALKQLTGFPAWTIVAALALSVGMTSLPFGENIPLAIGAICACAWFAARGEWRSAGVAAAIAMIEPQIGLGAALALFIWKKQSRLVLVVAAVGFALLSLVFLGPAANVEYFTRVLPAQALSEISRDTQYSVSSVLLALGSSDVIAARIGEIEYALAVACGILAGRLLAQRYAENALVVLVPVAFGAAAGPYVHITQIAAALPACIILLRHSDRYRGVVLTALLLLAVPWLHAPFLVTACIAPIAALAWALGGRNVRTALISALVAAVLVLGLSWLAISSKPHAPTPTAVRRIDSDLPQASWLKFTQSGNSTGAAVAWAERIPTWIGVFCLIFGVIAQSVPNVRRQTLNVRRSAPPETAAAP